MATYIVCFEVSISKGCSAHQEFQVFQADSDIDAIKQVERGGVIEEFVRSNSTHRNAVAPYETHITVKHLARALTLR